jgi:Holliday junction resolvase RusA-like endonuclease
MKINFTIKGELTDLNTYIQSERGNRYSAGKLKKVETQRVAWEIKSQRVPKIEIYPVRLWIGWYSKDNRKDIDNVRFSVKFILDGMVEAGILKGDGRKFVCDITDSYFIDKQNPRVEVEIFD